MAVAFLQSKTPGQVSALVAAFHPRYRQSWNEWIAIYRSDSDIATKAERLRQTLKSWNALGQRSPDSAYAPIEAVTELISASSDPLKQLRRWDVRGLAVETNLDVCRAPLNKLWEITGRIAADPNRATLLAVGKAVMLLTEGRFGPAFDRFVCKQCFGGPFPSGAIRSCEIWLAMLTEVAKDISAFEEGHGVALTNLSHDGLASGRIYDMAAGPRAT